MEVKTGKTISLLYYTICRYVRGENIIFSMRNLLYNIYLDKVKYISIFTLIVSFYSNFKIHFINFYEKNNVPQYDFDSLIENYDLDYSKNKTGLLGVIMMIWKNYYPKI